MNKTAPSLANLLTIVLFALTCFGLLLFLWLAFGGPSPLAPKGYQFNVGFRQSSQLAEQADVRISGVPVGRVTKIQLGDDHSTRATIQLDARYAPAHVDMRAILRTKTLLGETYVELSPGTTTAKPIPEGGTLPEAQVAASVNLDEIFRAFDPETRKGFQNWMQGMASGLRGRSKDLSNAFGNFVPFTENADDLMVLLDDQSGDVRRAVSSTATVFDAFSRRQDQLRGLIRDGNATFSAIGASSKQLARTFEVLPSFERRSQATLRALDAFAAKASPLLDALQPGVEQMTPTFQTLARTAPALQRSLDGVAALTQASKAGFPALVDITGELQVLFKALTPPLRNLTPFVGWLGQNTPELQAFLANLTAASQRGELPDVNASKDTPIRRYLRISTPVNQLALASYPKRPGANRSNAYAKSGTLGDVRNLDVFSSANCTNPNPVITGEPTEQEPASVVVLLTQLGITQQGAAGESATVPAPGCTQQGPITWDGVMSSYPHLTEEPLAR